MQDEFFSCNFWQMFTCSSHSFEENQFELLLRFSYHLKLCYCYEVSILRIQNTDGMLCFKNEFLWSSVRIYREEVSLDIWNGNFPSTPLSSILSTPFSLLHSLPSTRVLMGFFLKRKSMLAYFIFKVFKVFGWFRVYELYYYIETVNLV